jgi:hypothetical protein
LFIGQISAKRDKSLLLAEPAHFGAGKRLPRDFVPQDQAPFFCGEML